MGRWKKSKERIEGEMETGVTEGGSFHGEPWTRANDCPLFQRTFYMECRGNSVGLPLSS